MSSVARVRPGSTRGSRFEDRTCKHIKLALEMAGFIQIPTNGLVSVPIPRKPKTTKPKPGLSEDMKNWLKEGF